MKLYLHVDRSERLKTGDAIQKEPYFDESLWQSMAFVEPGFADHIRRLCRDGLSLHGAHYLIRLFGEMHVPSLLLELHFEFVRHRSFPELPSRFQSFFAFREYESALAFARSKGGGGKIFEIAADKCFMGDMNLLKCDLDAANMERNAVGYWESRRMSSDPEYKPAWECLVDLPVEIGREALVNPLDIEFA